MMGRRLSTLADGGERAGGATGGRARCSPPMHRSRTSALIHCETSTGILNPLREIAAVVAKHGQAPHRRCDELVRRAADRRGHDAVRCPDRRLRQMHRRSAGHGLRHRAQGACWSARRATARRSRSICTTSTCTWRRRRSGATRRRRTSSCAFDAALDQFIAEGGQPARLARYTRNCQTLVDGMAELGFVPFLDPADPGADHRHLPRAGGPELRLQGVLRARARQGIHPLSGQAHRGRDLSRRLHRRHRCRRDAPCGQRCRATRCARWASGRSRRALAAAARAA